MVDATQATTASSVYSTVTSSEDRTTLNQEEFLTLLITELENQDPLSPMESQEMATQMAQFSSLGCLYSIDEQLGESLGYDLVMNQAINNTLAASLIGKEIVEPHHLFDLREGEPAEVWRQAEILRFIGLDNDIVVGIEVETAAFFGLIA